MFTPDTCCTLVPYFEIQDGQLDAFKALALKLVAKTRTEPGCMHYKQSQISFVARWHRGIHSSLHPKRAFATAAKPNPLLKPPGQTVRHHLEQSILQQVCLVLCANDESCAA